jgi:arylsulfatase A-like enzyme
MNLKSLFKRKRPNVIMLMIDGVRHDAIEKVQYYEELKKKAVFFPKLICYAPYTIASLNATFSGMYGNLNGVNGYYKALNFDKKNCFTLAQYLKEIGYYTESDMYIDDTIPSQGFDKTRFFGNAGDYKGTIAERHCEVLQQIKIKQPFFLFLDYENVHQKYVKNVIKKHSDFDKEYFENIDKNFSQYVGYVRESGDYLKTVLDKIKELGLYDNSIIIIFSDHGCSVGERVGEKVYGAFLYEYTIRTWAYFISNKFPKNKIIPKLARHIDILPTLLDILKIPHKDEYKKIQGKSLLPFIYGNEEDRVAYSETGGLGGPTPSPEVHNLQSVRTNEWKFIYNKSNKNKELYNLANDNKEKKNLAGKNIEIEEKLWNQMQNLENEHKEINEKFHIKVKNYEEIEKKK